MSFYLSAASHVRLLVRHEPVKKEQSDRFRDVYLIGDIDAVRAKHYGLIDDVLGQIDATVATRGPTETVTLPITEEAAAAESSRE